MSIDSKSPRDWMTVAEVAEPMGMGVKSVGTLLRSRRLGCRKVGPAGARYQITEAHLKAYLDSCEVEVRMPKSAPLPKSKDPAVHGRAGTTLGLDGKPLKYF